MSKQVIITITDDPNTSSCELEVRISADMDRYTLAAIKKALRAEGEKLINAEWNQMTASDREVKS